MIRQLLQLFEEVVRNRLASDDEANVDEVKTESQTATETATQTEAGGGCGQSRRNRQPATVRQMSSHRTEPSRTVVQSSTNCAQWSRQQCRDSLCLTVPGAPK